MTMTGNGDIGSGAARVFAEQHLTDDELNLLIDGAMPAAERARAEGHIAVCATCRESMVQFNAIAQALAAIPVARVPRSFQLGPKFAGQRRPFWSRFAALFMPMLPAMRAATVALALLLFGSTAYRALDDTSPSQPTSNQAAAPQATMTSPAQAQTSAPESASTDLAQKAPAPTEADGDVADDSAAGAADDESAETAPADSSATRQDQPPQDIGEAVSEGSEGNTTLALEAAVAASPEATASPTSTVTVTVTPAPTATPTSRPLPFNDVDVDEQADWVEWVQVISGAGLFGLLVLWAGLAVSRRRRLG
jgi:hypothetical protein